MMMTSGRGRQQQQHRQQPEGTSSTGASCVDRGLPFGQDQRFQPIVPYQDPGQAPHDGKDLIKTSSIPDLT